MTVRQVSQKTSTTSTCQNILPEAVHPSPSLSALDVPTCWQTRHQCLHRLQQLVVVSPTKDLAALASFEDRTRHDQQGVGGWWKAWYFELLVVVYRRLHHHLHRRHQMRLRGPGRRDFVGSKKRLVSEKTVAESWGLVAMIWALATIGSRPHRDRGH